MFLFFKYLVYHLEDEHGRGLDHTYTGVSVIVKVVMEHGVIVT
jgi:hypothetical protein